MSCSVPVFVRYEDKIACAFHLILQMNTLFIDQPGLLGPKALMALIILSHARDEVHWLLRHADNIPQKLEKRKNLSDDLNDRQLPELLFYIEELRGTWQH